MKRLICCLDGTWNDDANEKALTNVVKLMRAIPAHDAHGVAQLTRYVIGIGTGYQANVAFAVGAAGLEVGERIRAAYQFLVDNYEPGDEIYLFGFSRGAFQARSLAGLIALLGIAKRDSGVSMDDAWEAYRRRADQANAPRVNAVRAAADYPVRVKCIGVWDTVGNIGNPLYSGGFVGRMVRFHDTSLSANVDVGLHALSIDEKRGPFRPILWTLPAGTSLPEHQHIEQVWFSGVHADVGGGYEISGLSDISLAWMAERIAATTGLAIDFDHIARTARPDPLAPQHCSAVGSIFKWSAMLPFVRLVHQDMRAIGSLRRFFLGAWRTNKIGARSVSVNEAVHDSVRVRFGQRVTERIESRERVIAYKPKSLVGLIGDARAGGGADAAPGLPPASTEQP